MLNHIVKFHSRKGLNAERRHRLLDAANHLGIVVDIVRSIDTAHDMHLRSAAITTALDHLQNLLHRVLPRTLLTSGTAIRAELALEQTHIRRLDVEVAIIVDFIATHLAFELARQLAQSPQRSLLPKNQSLLGTQALALCHTFCYLFNSTHTISVLYDRDIYQFRDISGLAAILPAVSVYFRP